MMNEVSTENRPDWLKKLEQLVQGLAEQSQCYLYDIEMVGTGGGRTLRVYIDSEAGAGIDDCTNVARALNEILDQNEEMVPGTTYDLEVSTPGADRVLRLKWHYEKAKGKKIWVKLTKALGEFGYEIKGLTNAKKLEDRLVDVSDDGITMSLSGQEVKLPFAEIEKAHVVFEFSSVGKKK